VIDDVLGYADASLADEDVWASDEV